MPESEEPVVPADEDEAKPSDEVSKEQTYKELRSGLIQKFLVQCDKTIAARENEKEIKAAR